MLGLPQPCVLWRARRRWTCRDAPLACCILAAEPFALPDEVADLPAASALAQALQACAAHGALLILANPAEAFGAQRIGWASGVRALAIGNAEEEACWDALLSLGQPCYGVAGRLVVTVLRPRPANVLSALSFGAFWSCAGLEPLAIEESPRHIAWRCPEAVEAEIVARQGFVVARQRGCEGRYEDTGREGYVRAVLRGPSGTCWTQPRFVMPRAGHG